MNTLRALRFFAAVTPPGFDVIAAAVALLAFACYDAVRMPSRFDECYALALIFQMFAASTGFRERTVRGHFDPLLVLESGRRRIAGAHWAMSIVPGALVWAGVIAIDLTVRHTSPPRGLVPAAMAAAVYASTVVWAGGLLLTRYAAGLLWTFGLLAVAGSGLLEKLSTAVMVVDPSWPQVLKQTAAVLVAPILLLRPASFDARTTLGVVGVTALAWLAGVATIRRLDAELRELS